MSVSSLLRVPVALALVSLSLPAAGAAETSSRVIVSSTLNHSLLSIDAETLEFTQPPLLSRGTSPVRMDIADVLGHRFLFTANHGIAGSLGIFSLDGETILEQPASPVPTGGFGAVGVDAGRLPSGNWVVGVTNTWFALGGCSMPAGSLSLFELATTGVEPAMTSFALRDNVPLRTAIPYAAAIDERNGRVIAATNCGNELEVFDVEAAPVPPPPAPPVSSTASLGEPTRVAIGGGPDTTLFDAERDRSYTVNISGNSLSVVSGASLSVATTVPLPGAGPIDAALATSKGGEDWILTANGRDDTFSIISRDEIENCIQLGSATCPAAQIARIPAGVAGGAPEGITYDPVSGRAFIVNKSPIGAPSVSAVAIDESGAAPTGTFVGKVPLPAVDPALPVPAIIAFDAVVDVRA